MNAQADLQITVVYSPAPRVLHEITLTLPAGARVSDALEACAKDARFAQALTALQAESQFALQVGVWGKKVALSYALASDDRVEIYRPLRVDPKVARRERFKMQGAKSAGLFAQRRPGAKAGY
jgi:putative ubiquitin-RnfH superfamily antitoxin RatB of RatAB toxin-antitoxin module